MGGVVAQFEVCCAVGVTTLLTLLHLILHRPSQPLRVGLVLVAVVWIAYAYLQTVPLPTKLVNVLAPGTQSVRVQLLEGRFGQPHASDFDDGSTTSAASASTSTISTVPGLTRRTAAKYSMALGVMFCSLVLFNTRRSRRVFAWTVFLNAAGLAIWGVVQQSSNSRDLFPGLENPMVSSHFSTFVYKNAGAAFLLAGISVAAGFLYWVHSGCTTRLLPSSFGSKLRSLIGQRLPRGIASSGDPSARRNGSVLRHYSRPNHWIDPISIGICCLLGVLLCGLLISQSRGACAAVLVATIVTLMMVPRSPRILDLFIGSAVLVVLATGFLWLADLQETAIRPADRTSISQMAADMRWAHLKDAVATAAVHAPLGTGIGNYGFAHLAQQSFDSPVWFREVHNQYLEAVTEAGVPGGALLLVFCWMVGKACWSLFRRTSSREAKGWGLVGLLLFLALLAQSVVDFVVVIPANLLLFSAVFGVVFAVYHEHLNRRAFRGRSRVRRSSQLRREPAKTASVWYTRFTRIGAVPVTCLVSGLVLCAASSFRQQEATEQALIATVVPPDDQTPDVQGDPIQNCGTRPGDPARSTLRRSMAASRPVETHAVSQ